MFIKIVASLCLLSCSAMTNAAILAETPEVEDTKLVLLKAESSVGKARVQLVKTFIEKSLSVKLNTDASKGSRGTYRFKSNKWITPSEQKLISDTLPTDYDVSVSFPADLTKYKARPSKAKRSRRASNASKSKD